MLHTQLNWRPLNVGADYFNYRIYTSTDCGVVCQLSDWGLTTLEKRANHMCLEISQDALKHSVGTVSSVSMLTNTRQTVQSTVIAYYGVIRSYIFTDSLMEGHIDKYAHYKLRTTERWGSKRLSKQERQREINWWEGVSCSVAAFCLEEEYLKNGDCTVSWNLLQYFITEARSGIKS